MHAALRKLVWDRAGGVCEYCRLPQSLTVLPHAIDHIVSRQHRGATTEKNLCLACAQCNAHKGPNISGIDPLSKGLTRLFNPRIDCWEEHFRWQGAILEGISEVGRATVEVLAINTSERLHARRFAIAAGDFQTS
jgi:hypothetical protein